MSLPRTSQEASEEVKSSKVYLRLPDYRDASQSFLEGYREGYEDALEECERLIQQLQERNDG